MSLFYLNLRTPTELLIDPEGSEVTSLEAARSEAIAAIREIVAQDVRSGGADLRCSVEICDAEGVTVSEVPYTEAVHVIAWGHARVT
jgi:hypothetical protein